MPMKDAFRTWFSARQGSTGEVLQDPNPLIQPDATVEVSNGRHGGSSQAKNLSSTGKIDADLMVEAVQPAQRDFASLTVEAPDIQAKLESLQPQLHAVEDRQTRAVAESEALQTQLRAMEARATRAEAISEALQKQLQAMEDRAIRAEENSLRCHQEFFVFQTNAVQQIRHLQDVARISQQGSVDDSAGKAQLLQQQNIINDLQEKLQKQELEREEEKQELLKEIWEQQQIAQSLQAKEEMNESIQKQKEVLKVPLIDDRRRDSGGKGTGKVEVSLIDDRRMDSGGKGLGKGEVPMIDDRRMDSGAKGMGASGSMQSGRFTPVLGQQRSSQVARQSPTAPREGRSRHKSPVPIADRIDHARQSGKEEFLARCRPSASAPSRPRSPTSVSSWPSNFEPLGGSFDGRMLRQHPHTQEVEQPTIDSRFSQKPRTQEIEQPMMDARHLMQTPYTQEVEQPVIDARNLRRSPYAQETEQPALEQRYLRSSAYAQSHEWTRPS